MNCDVLFFPSKENEQKIIDFINQAKKELKVCVFTFTNQNIAIAILNKVMNEKVKVRIITDDVQNAGASSIVNVLQSASDDLIKFRTDLRKDAHMHHKYVVIDDKFIATGSFNWTQAAVMKNNENLLLIRDENIAKQYSNNFEELWKEFQSTELTISKLSSAIKIKGNALKVKCASSNSKKKWSNKTQSQPKNTIPIAENEKASKVEEQSNLPKNSINQDTSNQQHKDIEKIKKGIQKNPKNTSKKQQLDHKIHLRKAKKLRNLEQMMITKRAVIQNQIAASRSNKIKAISLGVISFTLGAVTVLSSQFLSSFFPSLF